MLGASMLPPAAPTRNLFIGFARFRQLFNWKCSPQSLPIDVAGVHAEKVNVDYLLMCVKDTRLSRFPTALAYLKLLDIKSGQQLFEDMQPLYYESRSKVILMFSVRTLKSIQFARVYSISFTPNFGNCESG